MKQKTWKMKLKSIMIGTVLCVLFSLLLTGCKSEGVKIEKLRDLEFTVTENSNLPEELKNMVNEKKKESFKLSFGDGEYLYIALGYGEQKTGGYCIQVDALYETENAIYLDTSLLGPSKDESVEQAVSYPYIVVKTEMIDKNIVFE